MKKVVIIGGGFAGSELAKNLENKFKVTLIDNKDYFEFTPSVLKLLANPNCQKHIHVLHSDYLKNAKFIKGKVGYITDDYVVLNGKKIGFDYLVVATGSSYDAPFKYPRMFLGWRAKELDTYNKRMASAKKIVVIGGGLVGTELVAELAYYFPDKENILISSKNCLLERLPLKAQEYAHKFLENKGVKIVFEERVKEHDKNYLVTEKGQRIETDVAFACIGITPNSLLLKKNFRDKVTNRGFVDVDDYLRLQGKNNIFIAGDLTNIDEEKTAQNAERHAKLIAKNIILSEKGKDMIKYEKKTSPIVVSLGPRDGILVKGNFVLTGPIPAMIKWIVEWKEMWKKRI